MEKLYAKIEEILEEDITDETVFQECEEWDSLSILTLVAFIDKEYGVNLYANDIKQAKTVGMLVELIKSK